jgi:hypothetical protein
MLLALVALWAFVSYRDPAFSGEVASRLLVRNRGRMAARAGPGRYLTRILAFTSSLASAVASDRGAPCMSTGFDSPRHTSVSGSVWTS